MDIRKQGIVIRTTDVGESDRLVTLLTPDCGRLTVRAKGCRSAKSKLRYATQLFCFGEYLLAHSKAGYIITGCDAVENFEMLSGDLAKFYVGSVVLETADKLSREDNPDAPLFVAVLSALKQVAFHDRPLHSGVCFLLDALRLGGHAFRCVCSCGEEGAWVDLPSAAICCPRHKTPVGMPVSADTLAYLTVPSPDIARPVLHEAYVLLARCIWHSMGVKLNTVQELCKQWDVL